MTRIHGFGDAGDLLGLGNGEVAWRRNGDWTIEAVPGAGLLTDLWSIGDEAWVVSGTNVFHYENGSWSRDARRTGVMSSWRYSSSSR